MFGNRRIEDLPEYLRGIVLDGLNIDELDQLGQYLSNDSGKLENQQSTKETAAGSDGIEDKSGESVIPQKQVKQSKITARKNSCAKTTLLKEPVCSICGITTLEPKYRGVKLCQSCRKIYRTDAQFHNLNKCLSGNAKCDIGKQPKMKRCRFCRFWKGIELGLGRHWSSDNSTDNESSQASASDTNPKYLQGTNPVPINGNQLKHPPNHRLVNLDQQDQSTLPNRRELSQNSPTASKEPIVIITIDDSPPNSNKPSDCVSSRTDANTTADYPDQAGKDTTTASKTNPPASGEFLGNDEFGLPNDINIRFSRWLYGDLDEFFATKKKNPKDERTPIQKLRRKRKWRRLQIQKQQRQQELTQQDIRAETNYNHELGCKDIKFLTQDLEVEALQEVEEILIPSLTVSHSLLDASPIDSESRKITLSRQKVDDGNQTKDYTQVKLTLTLESKKTTIDRRPMLKRLKNSNLIVTNRIDGNEVTSTALIGPGEDCDDSDDNEFLEIDCD